MTRSKRFGLALSALLLGLLTVEVGERFSVPGISGYISTAMAIVGRPLTPVSVAGVARRSARRCAAGIYC
jgi:hypothetical protein